MLWEGFDEMLALAQETDFVWYPYNRLDPRVFERFFSFVLTNSNGVFVPF